MILIASSAAHAAARSIGATSFLGTTRFAVLPLSGDKPTVTTARGNRTDRNAAPLPRTFHSDNAVPNRLRHPAEKSRSLCQCHQEIRRFHTWIESSPAEPRATEDVQLRATEAGRLHLAPGEAHSVSRQRSKFIHMLVEEQECKSEMSLQSAIS